VKAAREFTAVAYTELLSPMFDTVDTSDGPFGGGGGERAFAPMWIAEIAKHMAQQDQDGHGMGLTNLVAEQMEKMAQSKKTGTP
jgi:Rod binding domain-containing protein